LRAAFFSSLNLCALLLTTLAQLRIAFIWKAHAEWGQKRRDWW
jgi:hypothetical protein